MYFINIKQLKQDIVNKEFTEKDRFIYMFIYIAIYAIIYELAFFENSTAPVMSDYISSIGTVIITVIGTYYLYRANGGNDGEDFLGRYFSITWVVSMRLLLLVIIFIGISIIINMNFIVDSDMLDIAFVLFGLLYDFLIYYCSYGYISEISKKVKV